jgi:hypothetical protein
MGICLAGAEPREFEGMARREAQTYGFRDPLRDHGGRLTARHQRRLRRRAPLFGDRLRRMSTEVLTVRSPPDPGQNRNAARR